MFGIQKTYLGILKVVTNEKGEAFGEVLPNHQTLLGEVVLDVFLSLYWTAILYEALLIFR
jgi:hypothetical protein